MTAEVPEGSVDFREYFAVLRRRALLILGVVAICVGLALAYSFTRTPQYTSQASVLVRPLGGDPLDPPNIQQSLAMSTEREVMTSPVVAQRVAESLNSELDADALLGRLTVSVPVDTQVLALGFEHPDPQFAQLAAQGFADEYLAARSDAFVADRERQSAPIRDQIERVRDNLAQARQEIADSDAGSVERATAQSNRDALTSELITLQQRLTDLESVSFDAGDVLSPATLPTRPSSPDHVRTGLLGLALGLLLGVALAFLRDRLDDRVRTNDDMAALTGLPLLTTVPRFPRSRRATAPVVALREPGSLGAESFRRLRSTLFAAAAREQLQTLLVTSPMAGEGKSTTATNLAVVLAQADKRVALISADLRRPRAHELLGVDNSRGLSQVLSGDLPVDTATRHVAALDGLWVLPSGPVPERPGDLIQSRAMNELINSWRGVFDYVVIDGPPILAAADCLELSRVVDGVLVVAKAGSSTRRRLARACWQLQQVGAVILGTVLVNAESGEDVYAPYGDAVVRHPPRHAARGPGGDLRSNTGADGDLAYRGGSRRAGA